MTTRLKSKTPVCALVAVMGLTGHVIIAPGAAFAAPLEPEACAALTAERTALVSQGLETDMMKGAAWARQNLAQDRLFQIKRLIEVNEQLSFRCGIMVTERPTLSQRTPPAAQAMATPGDEDGQQQKKPTKSKPKPAANPPPAGIPGSKPKPAAKQAGTSAPKPMADAKPVPDAKPIAEKMPPIEKAGN